MNCPKCEKEINDDSLICKECGYQFALEAQKEKHLAAKTKLKNLYMSEAKATPFLLMAIGFTTAAAFTAFSFILSFGSFPNILLIIDLVIMIISLVGMWKAYGATDDESLADGLKKISYYDTYKKIIFLIYFSVSILVVLAALFLSAQVASCASDLGGSSGELAIIIVPLFIIGCGIPVVFFFLSKIFKNRAIFFKNVGVSINYGKYMVNSVSTGPSYFLGVVFALYAIVGFASAAFLGKAVEMIGFMLSEIEIGDFLLDFIKSYVDKSVYASISVGVIYLANTFYFFGSAQWMASLHSKAKSTMRQIDKENQALIEITNRTKKAVEVAKKEKELALQKAEEERLRKEREEREKAERERLEKEKAERERIERERAEREERERIERERIEYERLERERLEREERERKEVERLERERIERERLERERIERERLERERLEHERAERDRAEKEAMRQQQQMFQMMMMQLMKQNGMSTEEIEKLINSKLEEKDK